MNEVLKEYGMRLLVNEETGVRMQLVSIIGEIEGHESASSQTKTTKYEHMLPILASLEQSDKLDGILFLINTVGGDVSCGLALAEMIAVRRFIQANSSACCGRQPFDRGAIVSCGRLHSDRPIGDSDHSSGTHERNGAWSAADI